MKPILLIFIVAVMFSGCNPVDSKPDCSLVSCAANPVAIKLKYVSKTTGTPLFGTSGAAFTTSDLKGTKGAPSAYTIEFTVDNNDNSVIAVNNIADGDVIKLGTYDGDKITLNVKAFNKECCSPVEITSLKINDEMICAPCKDLATRVITIAK